MKRVVIPILSGLLISALLGALSYAQEVSIAQIYGTVRDQTGAASPGAEVTVTQTDTGLKRNTLSDNSGAYTLQNLPPGPYRLEVSMPGFRTYVQTGIVLQVNANPAVDVVLQPGQPSDQVQVQANVAMVETRNSGVGQVMENQLIVGLPSGRRITDLILLLGAVTPGSDPVLNSSRNYPTQSLSVAGGLASGTTYVLDGSVHNDPYNNLNLPLPFADALQEFKLETSALPAQYGLHSAAAVNAVTKSGANGFHGDVFEFVRNYKFNAKDYFAARRDTLKRNQFGGVFGGPVVKNKLFFFGGYQGTTQRSDPAQKLAFVPTPAMLAGDWTAFASAACNAGRSISLRPPFVNNRIDPGFFSKPAVTIASRLPATSDSCGQIRYTSRTRQNEQQAIAKIDYQRSAGQSLFGRYIASHLTSPDPYDLSKNLLTTTGSATDDLAQSLTLGGATLIDAGTGNSFRVTWNRSAIARLGAQFFSATDIGVNIYSYLPKYMNVSVSSAFSLGSPASADANNRTTTVGVSDDLSLVRGAHQVAIGTNLAHWQSNTYTRASAMGQMLFNGQATGLALADFMTGNLFTFAQGAPTTQFVRQWYLGLYGQDTWQVKPRLTLNYGVRWEPYWPMQFPAGTIYHFDSGAFTQGKRTTRYKNAPAGLFYPGDAGFPSKAGMNKQWKNFAPRAGVAWDPKGDGRMSIRASYGIFYDMIPAQYHLNTVAAPPWGVRITLPTPPGGFADPWRGYPGGNPFPVQFDENASFPTAGTFNTFNYDTHNAYAESWNVTVQRQVRTDWLLSASYLGNQFVHLFGAEEINPAVFIPGGPCTINGLTYNPCSAVSNTNQRRRLFLENPKDGQSFGSVTRWDDGGTGNYKALLLSAQRRFSRGVIIIGNYTWSHCISDAVNSLPGGGDGVHVISGNRRADRGNCNTSASDRRHVANIAAVAETPKFSGKWLGILANRWSISGILTLSSGAFLTATTGFDRALTGIGSQRPDQVLDDIYGDKSFTKYLNPAAFALPRLGTNGNLGVATILGPGLWNLDTAVSRVIRIRENQNVEFRAEAFNLTNSVRKGNPNVNLSSPIFGRITTALAPRIMQFALRYAF